MSDLTNLSAITGPLPVAVLDQAGLRELQIGLSRLGYPLGDPDGLFGPKTRSAWAEFKTDMSPGNPDLIGPDSVLVLQDQLKKLPSSGTPDLTTKDAVIRAIRQECQVQGIGLAAQIAYVLATAQWETNQTFKPVKEAYWLSEDWRRQNLRYYRYYGRGYVQLTWEKNYAFYSPLVGVDLVDDPDSALAPRVALFVLVHGFKTGIFTGRKITDYINADKTDFVNARRCINGTDRATEIAKIAEGYLSQS